MVLKDVMDLLKSVAHDNGAYAYGNVMVEHINVVRYALCSRNFQNVKLRQMVLSSRKVKIPLFLRFKFCHN